MGGSAVLSLWYGRSCRNRTLLKHYNMYIHIIYPYPYFVHSHGTAHHSTSLLFASLIATTSYKGKAQIFFFHMSNTSGWPKILKLNYIDIGHRQTMRPQPQRSFFIIATSLKWSEIEIVRLGYASASVSVSLTFSLWRAYQEYQSGL